MSAEILRQVWLFSGLSRDQLDALSSFTFQKTFYPGDLIVEEGRTGNGCYVVMSGEVEVVKGLGTQGEKVLAQRGAGEVFGEMALLVLQRRLQGGTPGPSQRRAARRFS